MTESTRPTRLDIRDLPRDEKRVLSTLRAVLVKTFNYVRRYPLKLAVLEETLRFVHGRVREEQNKANARIEEAAKVAEIEAAEADDAKLAEIKAESAANLAAAAATPTTKEV